MPSCSSGMLQAESIIFYTYTYQSFRRGPTFERSPRVRCGSAGDIVVCRVVGGIVFESCSRLG